jgi:hypothetical protein
LASEFFLVLYNINKGLFVLAIIISNVLVAQNLVSIIQDTLLMNTSIVVSVVGESISFTAMQTSSISIQIYGAHVAI